MKRWMLFPLFLVAVLLGSAACGDDDNDLTGISLALEWFANANHTGVYLALDRGYFKEEGLDVTVIQPDDPSTNLVTVGAGEVDFAFEYQIGVLMARSQGVPVVSIAGVVQHPLNSVMALKESGIARPADLIGKSVGYPGVPTDPPLLKTMLEADGLSQEEVAGILEGIVNVGYDLVPALISKRVDAIVGAYWTHESISSGNLGYPVNVMRMEDWGVPDFYELVLVASEEMVAENSNLVEKFIRAITRGYREAAQDPRGSIEILLNSVPEADPEIDRPGVELLAPLWIDGVPTFGWQTNKKWTTIAQWMKDNAFLSPELDPAAAFTNRFVEATQ